MIDISEVHVAYGKLKALNGVTLQINEGAVGLLGPNGAGKSTLLKTMLGFLRPNAGSAKMFGEEMPKHAISARHKIGYMPEREITSPRVSAVSFLTYCGCLYGMTRVDAMERAHEVLNYIRMGDNRYRKMETYSTGMLQRVKFAQALIHDPKLLLLDEPTNGLDPEGRMEMLELIKELGEKRRITIVISSHLLPDVTHVCGRIVVVGKGKVLRDGPIEELTALRKGMYAVRVHDAHEAFMTRLDEAAISYTREQDGTYMITLDAHEPRAAFEIALSAGTQIRHFVPLRHRLEEVFMQALEAE